MRKSGSITRGLWFKGIFIDKFRLRGSIRFFLVKVINLI
jgi:hypothetical protein